MRPAWPTVSFPEIIAVLGFYPVPRVHSGLVRTHGRDPPTDADVLKMLGEKTQWWGEAWGTNLGTTSKLNDAGDVTVADSPEAACQAATTSSSPPGSDRFYPLCLPFHTPHLL